MLGHIYVARTHYLYLSTGSKAVSLKILTLMSDSLHDSDQEFFRSAKEGL